MRLSQVIAVEKTIKQKLNTEGAELHKNNQKQDLFVGMNRTYEKIKDEDETLPSESKKVQRNAEDNLKAWGELWAEYLGTVVTKDTGNCLAQATVTNSDLTFLAPVTFLVWLEKQLQDHRTFVLALPVLDSSRDWKKDDNTGLYQTDVVRTARTKKVAKVVTKAAATEHHPAQAEIVHEDVLAGFWLTTGLSGSISETRRKELLGRVDGLIQSVKQAREEANSTKVDSAAHVGKMIVQYLIK